MAVLYNGGDLNFDPSRFTGAWGERHHACAGEQLSVRSRLGMRSVCGTVTPSYAADALASTTSPRRTFNSAVTSVNYATTNGYPAVTNGRSIAWRGIGSAAIASNWSASANVAFWRPRQRANNASRCADQRGG